MLFVPAGPDRFNPSVIWRTLKNWNQSPPERKDGPQNPSRIHIPYRIYSIHSTFTLVRIAVNQAKNRGLRFGGRIAQR